MTPEPTAAALRAPTVLPREGARPNMRLLSLLALGHMIVDINQGSLAAVLPFLKSSLALSYTATGLIVLVANTTSSLIQPLFGYLADQTSRRWLLPVSVTLASIGLGLVGFAPSLPVVLALVVLMGFGVAAYHPEGYRTATAVAGSKKATGVSVFSTGGNIGVAVGPPFVTALIATFGLPGTAGVLVPGLLVAGLLTARLSMLGGPAPAKTRTARDDRRTMVGAMSLLVLVITLRSWTQVGFSTYLPFYYIEVLGGEPAMVGTLLAVFLGAGVLGTLVAGPIADRVGMRPFLVAVMLLVTPIAVSVLFASRAMVFPIVGLLGFVLVSSFTVSVVLGQSYLPRNPGMASGMIVGFAIGAGGIGASALGGIADHWGLASALWISALVPLLGFAVALFLPDPRNN